MARVALFAGAAMSLNLLIGNAGLISVGQGIFLGLGAYTVAVANIKYGLSFTEGAVLAMLLSVAAGCLVAAIALRARALFFALLTLAIAQVFYVVAARNYDLTGGDDGLVGIAVPDWLDSEAAQYLASVGGTTLVCVLLLLLLASPFGATLRAVRDNPDRVASLGGNPKLYEFSAFVIAGLLATFVGIMAAAVNRSVEPGMISWTTGTELLVMVALGGRSTFLGPIAGAILLEFGRSTVQRYSTPCGSRRRSDRDRLRDLPPGGPRRSTEGRRCAAGTTIRSRSRAGTGGRGEGCPLSDSQTIPALEATGLKKSFGSFAAVRDASVIVRPGEIVAIIGPNGAGKTTFFDLLTGRKAPDAGRVKLFGHEVTRLPPWRRVRLGLGRSFQVSSVFGSLSALENVQIGIALARRRAWHLTGLASHRYRKDAEALLEQVGLADRMSRAASELSHGDQRSLELAVALSSDPKILLLDEPTAGMGVAETEECLNRISTITRQGQIPVLFVEHDMSVVFSFATRVVVLAAGEVLMSGSPAEVRGDERVREVYFGEEL
ncbi:branched-chain amino acid ABC transporter ATP-binding protein/permease [Micromonospora sp. STR1s_5]|nr:branched-chain amino acid ABC transporter ATP-binding protein/permease [Micromonospora sp. STR1s_5]